MDARPQLAPAKGWAPHLHAYPRSAQACLCIITRCCEALGQHHLSKNVLPQWAPGTPVPSALVPCAPGQRAGMQRSGAWLRRTRTRCWAATCLPSATWAWARAWCLRAGARRCTRARGWASHSSTLVHAIKPDPSGWKRTTKPFGSCAGLCWQTLWCATRDTGMCCAHGSHRAVYPVVIVAGSIRTTVLLIWHELAYCPLTVNNDS